MNSWKIKKSTLKRSLLWFFKSSKNVQINLSIFKLFDHLFVIKCLKILEIFYQWTFFAQLIIGLYLCNQLFNQQTCLIRHLEFVLKSSVFFLFFKKVLLFFESLQIRNLLKSIFLFIFINYEILIEELISTGILFIINDFWYKFCTSSISSQFITFVNLKIIQYEWNSN